MQNYRSKLALITGGSSGIGFALAKEILFQGGSVAILARHAEALSSAKNELSKFIFQPDQQIHTIQADVTQKKELETTLLAFVKYTGLPDLVFNSAGVARPGNFSALPDDVFHWMMDVNYFGTVNVLKVLVPLMQKRRSGTIVNISSVAGFIGVYGYTAYGASKFAVSGFSDALRAELQPYSVQVSIVFPPDTDTPQLEYESQFKPFITKEIAGSANLMKAETVANEIIKGILKNKYLILPGTEAKLLYFAHNFLGGKLYPVMDLMVRSAIKKIKFGD